MNSALRLQFEVIQEDQARLHRFVANLDRRIEIVARQIKEQAPVPLDHSPPAATPPPLPPPRDTFVPHAATPPVTDPAPETSVNTPLLEKKPVPKAEILPHKEEPAIRPPAAPAAPSESWEMAFGTVWLARIGIVILLTGLVFLGNYAWQHVVSELGAGGKLTLLYLASGLLGGLGVLLERGKETMRNYARVLIAGGAATVYYATYAAHYVDRLRVIENPFIGGTLLLGLAGGFIAWADRHRSQTVGLLAILLAYYTSAINPIGVFTLFSGVLLTGASMFFLVRHRWTTLGWVSLAGTYGSYTFWQWHQAVGYAGTSILTDPTPVVAVAFLTGYWLLFTTAGFLGKESALASARPSLFVTANNGAFFALAGHQIAMRRPDLFWFFALAFGGALLGLAALARWRRTESPSLEGSYLAQGLAMVTLGLLSKFTGTQLALMLAVESALLLTWAGKRYGWLYQIAAALIATAAASIAGWQMQRSQDLALPLGGTISAVLLADAWWLKQRLGRLGRLSVVSWSWRAAGFTALGLFLLSIAVEYASSTTALPAALAGIAVVTTAVASRLRLPELLLGQVALALAALQLAFQPSVTGLDFFSPSSAFMVIAAALALEQWWQRQRRLAVQGATRSVFQLLCAAGGIAVGTRWLGMHFQGESWIWVTSAAAMVTLLYGVFTRAWATAVVGQFFTLLAAKAFLLAIAFTQPHAAVALIPIITVAAIGVFVESVIGRRYASVLPEGLSAKVMAQVYRLTATAGLALWGLHFVSGEWLAPFFAGLGALLALAGTYTRNPERALTGLVFHGLALATLWFRVAVPVSWPGLLAVVLVPASLRLARHLAGEAPLISEDLRRVFTAAATATAWLWVTRWTVANHGSQGLTMAWSALALLTFAVGLGLQERVYRLGGFAILTLAVGRVFLFDVWRLETLYRILSFLVLGAVLLLLGFVYNRYAEKIRRWL